MILRLKVKPGSKKEEIIKKENILHVHIKENTENNKANIELINLLSKYFNRSTKDIIILRGKTSRNKIVAIKD